MAGNDAVGIGVFFGYVVLCTGALLVFLSSMWRNAVISSTWAAMKRIGKRMRDGEPSDDDKELGAMVREKMGQLAVEHMQLVCQGFFLFVFPFLVNLVVTVSLERPRSWSSAQDCIFLVVYGCSTLVMLAPSVISTTTINAWYCFFLLCAGAFVLPPLVKPDASRSFDGFDVTLISLPSLLLNMARRPNLKLGTVNLLLGAAASSYLVSSEDTTWKVRPLVAAALQLAWFYFLPVVLARVLERSLASAIRLGLKSEAAEEILGAATGLLRSCCDVVVELDLEGVILSPAEDLAGFLLMQSGRRLRGARLEEHMPEEQDRAAFLRHLREQRSGGKSGLAEALHVSLRDVDRNVLAVELLSFKFKRLDGRPRFMIGIREFDDKPTARCCGSSRRAGQQEEELETSGPSRTDSGGVDSFNEDLLAQQAAVVVVDSNQDGLPVRGYSSAFRQHMGRLPPGTKLCDLVQGQAAFASWVQNAVNADIHGEDSDDHSVTLETRQGRLKARCRLLRRGLDEGDDPREYLQNTQILFFNITTGRHSRSSMFNGIVGAPLSLRTSL